MIDSGSDTAIRAMFAARKSVFVDLLKWDLPVLDGRYELDQFDDSFARYLIITDRDQQHLGSARLLPTARPHLLDTVFPALCDAEPPRGERIWEITRFCLDRRLRAAERFSIRNQLVTALVEHALANGVERYTGVAEMAWLQQILCFGWQCRALGEPIRCGRSLLGALEITITADTPDELAAGRIWSPIANRNLAAFDAVNA
ncbi:GNAT family N-acetyltransferase [Sphingomonas sp. LB-2]|uniref:acyl-homoserine-lactone synthase n=1 Tax=Sphingomonas caeni TaxID=2984949 RepID=UPI0022307E69|nr:acyl-homoserine-lactone synthase [Sphingomonas caeni]MCW3847923.1 GNAT family N-acetyltransferase [Sphingomonas caeni]